MEEEREEDMTPIEMMLWLMRLDEERRILEYGQGGVLTEITA